MNTDKPEPLYLGNNHNRDYWYTIAGVVIVGIIGAVVCMFLPSIIIQ